MLYKNTVEPSTLELLKNLQSSEALKDFHLVGGTALALHLGHRKSIDLDLFNLYDFDSQSLLEYLEQEYNFLSDYSAPNTLKGSINDIKIDLICHKYPFINQPMRLDDVRLLSIPDISAMKLNAIAGNGTRSKDFIDIYFILKQYSLSEILLFYKTKYHQRNVFHVIKSLVYFEDICMDDWPDMLLEKNVDIFKIKRFIEQQVINYQMQNL